MRRRLVAAMVAVAMVGVTVVGAPLIYVTVLYTRDEAQDRLAGDAATVEARVDAMEAAGEIIDGTLLAPLLEPTSRTLVVRTADGRTIEVGAPMRPRVITATRQTAAGTVIELSEPRDAWRSDAARSVAGIVGLGLAAVALAGGAGLVMARRLAAPLDHLTDAARRLGAGDFSTRAPRSGLEEVDAIATALDASAERIGALVARERRFSAEASHQLRTPLTAIALRLEELSTAPDADTVRAEADAAMDQLDRLRATVDTLLAAARGTPGATAAEIDLVTLARAQVARWAPLFGNRGRQIVLGGDLLRGRRAVRASPAAVEQALDVLIDNAYHHGRGRVEVTVRHHEGRGSIRVSDEGPGIPPELVPRLFERGTSGNGGHAGGLGLGLALARDLLAADGGRIELASASPPTFELWV